MSAVRVIYLEKLRALCTLSCQKNDSNYANCKADCCTPILSSASPLLSPHGAADNIYAGTGMKLLLAKNEAAITFTAEFISSCK